MNNQNPNQNSRFVAPLCEMEGAICEAIKNGGSFSMVTAGTSMLPLLRNRRDTVVLIQKPDKLKKYDIPLYKRKNGSFVLHRIMKTDGQRYTCCGDNQLSFEQGISHDDVIAVVSEISRGNKVIKLDKSISYSVYVLFWCKLFALRYIILKFRNLIMRLFNHFKTER